MPHASLMCALRCRQGGTVGAARRRRAVRGDRETDKIADAERGDSRRRPGASRFGGRDKSALVVDGRTILERQIVGAGAADRRHPDRRRHVSGAPARCRDRPGRARPRPRLRPARRPRRGARRSARDDASCSSRVRHAVRDDARLLGHLVELADGADVVVPRTERGYHPLCARLHARVRRQRVAPPGRAAVWRMRELSSTMCGCEWSTADELDAFGDPSRCSPT